MKYSLTPEIAIAAAHQRLSAHPSGSSVGNEYACGELKHVEGRPDVGVVMLAIEDGKTTGQTVAYMTRLVRKERKHVIAVQELERGRNHNYLFFKKARVDRSNGSRRLLVVDFQEGTAFGDSRGDFIGTYPFYELNGR